MFSNHFLFFFREMKNNYLTGKVVEIKDFSYTVGGNTGAAIMENRMKVPQKPNNRATISFCNLTTGYTSKNNSN